MKEEKEEKVKIKNKIDKQRIFSKIMALFLLIVMVLASCSTCIYFVIQNIK